MKEIMSIKTYSYVSNVDPLTRTFYCYNATIDRVDVIINLDIRYRLNISWGLER
jgi:hypothetical protein